MPLDAWYILESLIISGFLLPYSAFRPLVAKFLLRIWDYDGISGDLQVVSLGS